MRTCLLLLLLPLLANAQQHDPFIKKVDSLILSSAYEQALTIADEQIRQAKNPAINFQWLTKKSEILIAQGKLDAATQVLETLHSLPAPVPSLEAGYLTNLGYLYLNKGRHDLALEYLQIAHSLYQDGEERSAAAAKCLSYISLTYLATGKYNQAESNGLIALQIREALYGLQHEEVAASYNDLGLVYSQTDPDKALEFYERALTIYRQMHGNEHSKIAIAQTNIGGLYAQIELFGDATNNLEAALKIWKQIYPEGHPNVAFALRNLGQTYVKMGNNKTALLYLQQALDQYKKSYGEKHPDIASTLNQIGFIYLDESKYETGLDYFQLALQANIAGFNEPDIHRNPALIGYYNPTVLLFSLRLKAQGFEQLYFGKTLRLNDLKFALATLYLCDSLIDEIRHQSTHESDKIALGALASEVYEDGVRIATAMSELTVTSRRYTEAAFYFAEKSKSAVLQESIADAQAKTFAGIPVELVEDEKQLKSAIALLSQKLSQMPSGTEEKYLRESLFDLNQEYQNFIKKLETEYPHYFNLKFNTTSPTVSQLQKLLRPEEAIVSYFLAEAGDRIYQFVITSKSFQSRNLSLPENFERLTKGFINGIYYSDLKTYNASAMPLSKVLLPKVPARIKELIIIPSGRLGTLPFEALPRMKKVPESFEDVNYFGERLAVSYAFSTGLIAQRQLVNALSTSPSIFLCAPVQFPEKDNLVELPGTEKEVTSISSLFSPDAMDLNLYADANELKIKSGDVNQYTYLHFATHGVVDEMDPELSRIFLSENTGEDGNLFAGEIYNLNLNADLAVLSACQTGLGKFSRGEGVIGLSRALVYAGAKNLVVSFWSVSDESTAQLMRDFYEVLLQKKDENFRLALQAAKVKMIREKKFSAPYYWAPFVMIGF